MLTMMKSIPIFARWSYGAAQTPKTTGVMQQTNALPRNIEVLASLLFPLFFESALILFCRFGSTLFVTM